MKRTLLMLIHIRYELERECLWGAVPEYVLFICHKACGHVQFVYSEGMIYSEQQNCSRATHVGIIQEYDAGNFDLKVFVNCRVQGEIDLIERLYKTEEVTLDKVMNNLM